MYRTAFLVALAVSISAPAAAADPTSPAQPAAKADKGQDKIICKFVNTTGSRISRDRECKTRAQWEAESDAQREDFEHQSQRATGEATNSPH
ncbi:MAG: hypothetical protein ACTHOI_00140 [Sphingomicrobium sp.]